MARMPGTLLAIDDDQLTLAMMEKGLTNKGHHVLTADSGEAGLSLLQRHVDAVEVVLLDRRMPGLDGIGVVRRMKADSELRQIPIIMLTGADSIAEMREGMDAGVFYYLVKPAEESVLDSVLAAALRETRQRRMLYDVLARHRCAAQFIETARFRCRTLADAELLSSFLAGCFPEPERVLTGVAELLVNAVEHGNFGVGYQAKGELLKLGEWENEIERRSVMPEHAEKYVEIVLQRKDDGTYLQITDMGEGFDWQAYLTIDPSRATHNHGRGIAQAVAQCFDELRYNPKGNQVLAKVAHAVEESQALDW